MRIHWLPITLSAVLLATTALSAQAQTNPTNPVVEADGVLLSAA